MDSSQAGKSTSNPADLGEARSGPNLMLDEIRKLKERRLKLLDQFRNEQETGPLYLVRQSQHKDKKKKAAEMKEKMNNAVSPVPSRRSERIKSQAVNENKPPADTPKPLADGPKPPNGRPRPAAYRKHPAGCSKPPNGRPKPAAYRKPAGRAKLAGCPKPPSGYRRPAACRKPAGCPQPPACCPNLPAVVPHVTGAKGKARVKPKNIYGPTPGIEIGHQWNTRLECSHDGVHRPTIAGIHPGPLGAYSIALSGAYDEDIDEGDIVIFTGAGGRDLRGTSGRSRSVRSAPQIKDQELNGANLSLIKSLETGLPVRVIRGYKLGSCYAPERGYRYDGLYKVVQYCYTIGYSGYRIFRFRMSRLERQRPAPWVIAPRMNVRIPIRRRRMQRRYNPQFLYGGNLDNEIQDCIRKLCRESTFKFKNKEYNSFSTFKGWNVL